MGARAAEPIEEVGESSSPPRVSGGQAAYDIKNEIYKRLMESGNEEVRSNPHFKELFDGHFSRLPPSRFPLSVWLVFAGDLGFRAGNTLIRDLQLNYLVTCSYKLDLNVDRAEDVLIHQKILAEAKDPEKRPVFYVRFQKVLCTCDCFFYK
ncbi:hypothetical protein ZIOFF_052328 [Zingiber officinale]|uniref:Uncharacterized protein n=1 Tax=Zingiber officinale TaxID=94328 RepID=A0A8J5KNE8_ZINOF|nr:hypothetical protein ZIOFF_052328 [Zingiber officinale]